MKETKNIKAVVFDLDDTLYPEYEFVMSGFLATAKYLSKKYKLNSLRIFNILKSDFKKGVRGRNFNSLFKKFNLPEKEIKKLIYVYRNHEPQMKLFSDAEKLLAYLQSRKIKIALISDGFIRSQENKIKALKIKKYFQAITLSDKLGINYRKPSTKPFNLTLRKLSVKPSEAVYVADNPQKDFIGARKLGLTTIQIKRAGGIYGQVEVTRENKADLVINSLSQLKTMFNKTINILIVPAGSRIAIGIIKFLAREKEYRIISADIDKLAPGFYLSDRSYIVSKFSQKKFWSDLERIIKKEKINLVIPALDPLLIKFAENKKFFDNLKVKILISPSKTIFLTRDKWKTYNLLKNEIPIAKSFIDKNKVNIPYPLFIKPRDGSGSLNAFKINSQKELDFHYKNIQKPIIQEYLEGKEYTVDCLVNTKGKLLCCVPRERIGTQAGVSAKGRIVRNKKIEEIAEKITQKIKFMGPFFFQLKGKKGVLKLVEINPRFGGGMPLSATGGPNIYLLATQMFLGVKVDKTSKIEYGLYFTRYDQEIYLTKKDIKSKIYKI